MSRLILGIEAFAEAHPRIYFIFCGMIAGTGIGFFLGTWFARVVAP